MTYEIRVGFSPCYIDETLYSEPEAMSTIEEMVAWYDQDEAQHPVNSENDFFYQYRVDGGPWMDFDEILAEMEE